MRNTTRALDALRRAEHVADRLTGEHLNNSIYGYPVQQLAFHREATLTLVGTLRDAQRAQQDALSLYPPTEHVLPTLVRLDQAACIIRGGDRTTGYQTALAHLRATPPGYRTALVLSRARELADPTARPSRTTREYLEGIDALGVDNPPAPA